METEIAIHASFDEMINPALLKDHPKNRNKHSREQIVRLAKLYKYTGMRHPITVSNLSGCIVAGHGRKLAAIESGLKEVPVVYQDFRNEEEEYAFLTSDNAVALWSELDLSGINSDIGDLGPDFDLDHLGILNFKLDVSEHGPLDSGKSLAEYNENYDPMNIKQIILVLEDEDYLRAIDGLDKIKNQQNLETNTQAFMFLLEQNLK